MVIYNPKDWFKLIFKLHKSDTIRILGTSMIFVALYTGLVAYIEIEIFNIKGKGTTILHSMLGFVISLLLVFRTNTAYDRWWEGRKQWGALVNNSRNLAFKIKAFLHDDENELHHFKVLIANYAFALKEHLRNNNHVNNLESFDDFEVENINQINHLPNYLAQKLYIKLNKLYKYNNITGDQFIILNNEAKSLTDITGACERIKNTPIPYSYSLFIKKFIFIYVVSLPFGIVGTIGYYAVLLVVFTFYVLVSLELIAEEIEDPFGKDANDLPTDELAIKIKLNMHEILG